MTKTYLLCYDICNDKRLYQVRKISYPFALGGQKSALETPLSQNEAIKLLALLKEKIDLEHDKVNLIEFENEPLFLGKKLDIVYQAGAIIL